MILVHRGGAETQRGEAEDRINRTNRIHRVNRTSGLGKNPVHPVHPVSTPLTPSRVRGARPDETTNSHHGETILCRGINLPPHGMNTPTRGVRIPGRRADIPSRKACPISRGVYPISRNADPIGRGVAPICQNHAPMPRGEVPAGNGEPPQSSFHLAPNLAGQPPCRPGSPPSGGRTPPLVRILTPRTGMLPPRKWGRRFCPAIHLKTGKTPTKIKNIPVKMGNTPASGVGLRAFAEISLRSADANRSRIFPRFGFDARAHRTTAGVAVLPNPIQTTLIIFHTFGRFLENGGSNV
jgi:hypothetical protein